MVGRLGNRNSRAARGVNGFPINLSKRGILGEPLDQVGICDVGAAERDQICQTFR